MIAENCITCNNNNENILSIFYSSDSSPIELDVCVALVNFTNGIRDVSMWETLIKIVLEIDLI